ncbi:hypothetical protein [Patiriisocius marinus]|uniref:hypothetical protein n=1 Tax=Patiriisocius marinus TaxID=1397112 RepID=UPI00232EE4B4|nr:hypothetical protein [Patiriisocius marinus]
MTTDKENIQRTFSIFHDGTICGFEHHPERLNLKIDCYYLSERINSEFECFYVDLFNPTDFEFKPWSDKNISIKTISDLNIIAQWEYNIFRCNIENGKYEIDVEIEEPRTALIGGSIFFSCDGIKIYDQSFKEMTFEQLSELSKSYWTEFKNRNE